MNKPVPCRVAAVIEFETFDPRLSAERLNDTRISTPEETAITRQAVMDSLLRTDRVVLVTGPQIMQFMIETHAFAKSVVDDIPPEAMPKVLEMLRQARKGRD